MNFNFDFTKENTRFSWIWLNNTIQCRYVGGILLYRFKVVPIWPKNQENGKYRFMDVHGPYYYDVFAYIGTRRDAHTRNNM